MGVDEKILSYLKYTGPSLSITISKNVKEEHLITSAFLSEMASKKKVLISKMKIGSSPLYYLPDQINQLVNFKHEISHKDQPVLKRLEIEKVLRESDLQLVEKVGIRKMKDFAIPLQVQTNKGKEIFWRWFLISNKEMDDIISKILESTYNEPNQQNNRLKSQIDHKQIEKTERKRTNYELRQEQYSKSDEKSNDNQKGIINLVTSYPPNTNLNQKRKPEINFYPPNTANKQKISISNSTVTSNGDQNKEIFKSPQKEEVKIETIKPFSNKKSDFNTTTQEKVDNKKQTEIEVIEKFKDTKKIKKKTNKKEDQFLSLILNYFKELDIWIETKEIIRKNSEIDLIITIPSVIGRIKFFCKAKNKKRCDEKDISSAYTESIMKKIPLFFLYSNSLSKKAEIVKKSDSFDNMLIKKLEIEE